MTPRLRTIAALLVVASAPSAQVYSVTDLGPASGDARAINASAQVVGLGLSATFAEHAFLWSDGAWIDLGSLGGGSARAADLDELARVVGKSKTADGKQHAFLWIDGAMQDLGTLSGPGGFSAAQAINSCGVVVGESDGRAVHWIGGTIEELDPLPGGTHAKAAAVNDAGQIAGQSSSAANPFAEPVRWDASGAVQSLGTLGGSSGESAALDRDGRVAGYATDAAELPRPFLWDPATGMVDLGLLPGDVRGFATDLDDAGRVVGYSFDPSFQARAWLWEDGAMSDLNDLVAPGSGWSLERAHGIEPSGAIVGTGRLNGAKRAFLLEPLECVARVRPVGGSLGGTVAFRHASPCHPGLVAVTGVSISGDAASFPLPGGLAVRLVPDALTLALLATPSASLATLDGSGIGETSPIPIVPAPSLAGVSMFVVGAILDPVSASFVGASATSRFCLL